MSHGNGQNMKIKEDMISIGQSSLKCSLLISQLKVRGIIMWKEKHCKKLECFCLRQLK